MDNFSERIRALRGDRSQRDFATWIDESPQRVNNYETGYSKPSIDFVVKLVQKGVNPVWFLTGHGPMYLPGDTAHAEHSPEIQTLLHELKGFEELTPELVRLVRHAKDAAQTRYAIEQNLNEMKMVVAEIAGKFRKKKK